MPADRPDDLFQEGRAFWDQNPCDGQEDVAKRMTFRYRKEPWLPAVLERASRLGRMLEIGCGQGTDALRVCSLKEDDQPYVALDCSMQSLRSALRSASATAKQLRTQPQFVGANAERLPFPDGAFDGVLSVGVLHHSPDTQRAVDEAHRVLGDSGVAIVLLYRLLSPKLLAALSLRMLVRWVDRLAGREGYVCDWARRLGSNHFLGTMLLECAGVPVMRAYTRAGIRRLFRQFDVREIEPLGMGFPFLGINHWIDKGRNPLGAFWLVVAAKKGSPAPSLPAREASR